MNTDTAAEYLLRKLNEQRETIVEEVVRLPLSQEEYARLRGVVQGLDFAAQLINDLAIKLENDDG